MPKNDVYQIVTDKIIASLEAGVVPWKKPWGYAGNGFPMNFVSKKPYKGINVMMLSMSPFSSPYWMTYKQASSLGGQVRKGEKGSMVVYWNFFEKKSTKEDGTEKKESIPFLKYFTVFNLEQIDGIEAPEESKEEKEVTPIEECEKVVENFKNKPEINEVSSNKACYSLIRDSITIPKREQFEKTEEFYSTLFHELVHSTGHSSRLDRKMNTSFGSEDYSKEELIAELGASFLCANTGIIPKTEENSAAYIGSWLSKLREDKRLIVSASGKAQKAAEYILGSEEKEEN